MNDSALQSKYPHGSGDAPSLERAEELLRSRAARDRLRGVLSLANLGDQGLDLLSAALRDRNRKVQLAAATVLGELGDPRSVPALHTALRHCMVGGTGARQRAWIRTCGWLSWLMAGIAIPGLWRPDSASMIIPVCLSLSAAGVLLSSTSFAWARRREDLRNAILVALCRIAENGGGREVKSCLPDLEALAASRWGQSSGGRAGLATALQYFRSMPDMSTHPLPADGDRTPRTGLPLVADAGSISVGTLPVPVNDRGVPR